MHSNTRIATLLPALCIGLLGHAEAAEKVSTPSPAPAKTAAPALFRTGANKAWQPIDLSDLSVKPGSALDFSFLVEKGAAGQHGYCIVNDKGQFAFEKRPDVPVRFFVASQLPGSRPEVDFGDVDVMANQIRLAGYNAVRPHFLDDMLMYNTKQELVFNPDMVDRWDRYAAALKKNGIYLVLDACTSWGAFSGYIAWDKRSEAVKMKTRLYYDPSARAVWEKGVKYLFEHVNPHTGVALVNEPQVAWVALRNEPGLNFQQNSARWFDPKIVDPFRAWLKKHYASRDALAAAWGKALPQGADLDTVALPPLKGSGPDSADLQRFFTDSEQETYAWGSAYLKKLGLKALLIDYNNGGSMQSIISRDVLPFVDNHVYHDHPTNYISPGSKIDGTNSIAVQVRDVRWIAGTRAWGRPFSVTEWGGLFWNPYRHMDGMTFSAYAALQGWQLLAQHATPVASGMKVGGDKPDKMIPFLVAKDPSCKMNERIAAMLFARADVQSSPHKVDVRLDSKTLYGSLPAQNAVAAAITPLAMVCGFGSSVVGTAKPAPFAAYTPDLIISPMAGTAIKAMEGAEISSNEGAGTFMDKQLQILREKGVLGSQNRTNPAKKIFESDTGEILLDAGAVQFSVNTPRSQGLCLPNGRVKASVGLLEVENRGPCMTLLLSSLSELPLSQAPRLLLMVSGDSLNSNMAFKDAGRLELADVGRAPVLAQLLRIDIKASLPEPGRWSLWALAQNGSRLEKVPTQVAEGRLAFLIDTGKLKNGPSQYFELIRE